MASSSTSPKTTTTSITAMLLLTFTAFALLLLLAPHDASARRLSYRTALSPWLRRYVNTSSRRQQVGKVFWKTAGLFLSRSQKRQLKRQRSMEDVFVINQTRVAFDLDGMCGEMPAEGEEAEDVDPVEMPSCESEPDGRAGDLNGENWSGTTGGCCNTKMEAQVPQTVTSVVTGERHQVLQFSTSSQLVHIGVCENEGGMCVLGGRCTTIYRIQWLLVRSAPLSDDVEDDDGEDDSDSDSTNTSVSEDSDIFVPTMVANHCQCIFT